jgi:hypothetical protein
MKSEIHEIPEILVNLWLKNEKVCLFSEKIAKSYTTFNENKANFKNIKIGVSFFETSKYEILTAWRSKKQTQTNPIQSQFKPNPRKAKNERKFLL